MGQDRRERRLSVEDLLSLGVTGIAVFVIVAIRNAANPVTICIILAIVCGLGLAVGALLAEWMYHHDHHSEQGYIGYGEGGA